MNKNHLKDLLESKNDLFINKLKLFIIENNSPEDLIELTKINAKKIIEGYLLDGFNLEGCNENKQTPLMISTLYNYSKLCELYIFFGANVNAIDSHGRCVLSYSLLLQRRKILSILFEHNIDVTIIDKKGLNVFIQLSFAPTQDGLPRLDYVASKIEDRQIEANKFYTFIVNKLIDFGADVNHLCPDNRDAIYYSIQNDNRELTNVLLKHAPILTRTYEGGKSILQKAAEKSPDSFESLLRSGAPTNIINNQGENLSEVLNEQKKQNLIEVIDLFENESQSQIHTDLEDDEPDIIDPFQDAREIAIKMLSEQSEIESKQLISGNNQSDFLTETKQSLADADLTKTIISGDSQNIKTNEVIAGENNFDDNDQQTRFTQESIKEQNKVQIISGSDIPKNSLNINNKVINEENTNSKVYLNNQHPLQKEDIPVETIETVETVETVEINKSSLSKNINQSNKIEDETESTLNLDSQTKIKTKAIISEKQEENKINISNIPNTTKENLPTSLNIQNNSIVGDGDRIEKGQDLKLTESKEVIQDDEAEAFFTKNKKDVNIRNSRGQTYLMICAGKGDLEKASELLTKKANPNLKDKKSNFALLYAIFHKKYELVQLLLEHRANPNLCDGRGIFPLYMTVKKKDLQATEILLKFRANPNLKLRGRTPLMYAASYGRIDFVNLLLKHGADPNAKDFDAKKASNYAFKYGFKKLAKKLN